MVCDGDATRKKKLKQATFLFFSFYDILHVKKKEDKNVTSTETGSREDLALYGLKQYPTRGYWAPGMWLVQTEMCR